MLVFEVVLSKGAHISEIPRICWVLVKFGRVGLRRSMASTLAGVYTDCQSLDSETM